MMLPDTESQLSGRGRLAPMPDFYERLLPINPWSRPGWGLECVLGNVAHWTEPKTDYSTIDDVWAWWNEEGRVGHYGSAPYIVGRDGDICRVIPENEVSRNCGSDHGYTPWAIATFGQYADNIRELATCPTDVPVAMRRVGPNACTIGVEMIPCNRNSGEFTDKTLDSSARLFAYLLDKYPSSVFCTHHMVTNKDCPRFWVNNPKEQELFELVIQHYREAA